MYLIILESQNMVTIVAVAIAGILSTLALPKLYEAVTESKRIESNASCKEELAKVNMRMKEITTAVGMVLAIIETEFPDGTGQHAAIQKVKEIIMKRENND